MNSRAIWATIVLAVTITAAGIFAFSPIQEASSAAGGNPAQLVRDNMVITGPLTTGASTGALVGAVVLIDNAGIGGTSDVEVTWTAPFSDGQCRLVTVGGTPSATPGLDLAGNAILGNDMVFMTALGYGVAHNDVKGTQAILLVDTVVGGGGCSLGNDFISISTVASGP